MFWLSAANVWCAKYRPQVLHICRNGLGDPAYVVLCFEAWYSVYIVPSILVAPAAAVALKNVQTNLIITYMCNDVHLYLILKFV